MNLSEMYTWSYRVYDYPGLFTIKNGSQDPNMTNMIIPSIVLNKTFSGFTCTTGLKKDASDWTLTFTKDRGEHFQEILEAVTFLCLLGLEDNKNNKFGEGLEKI